MRRWWLVVTVFALAGCVKNDPPPPFGVAGSGAVAAPTPAGGAAPPVTAVAGQYSCGPADPTMTPQQLHAAALDVMGTAGKNEVTMVIGACSGSSCHVPPRPKAGLQLNGLTDLSTLKGKPSCEAPTIPLVSATATGDAALKGSWIWIKIVGDIDAAGGLVADPLWGSGGIATCGDTTTGRPFGARMPLGVTLNEPRLGTIRRWLCAGAPGPN